MLIQRSYRPYQDARISSVSSLRPIVTPRQNRLLAALPGAEYARILPHLTPVPLPLGSEVHGAGDRELHLYFVTAGIVSRFYVLEDGSQAGFSITGSEGAIGIGGLLGGEGAPSQAAVLCAGHSYRLRLDALQRELSRVPSLLPLLLRYTQALMTQTTQTVVCNRYHSVEQQMSRGILSCLDRLASNELAMTQELLAGMLGVRREAVTDAAGRLQAAGAIRYARGHIAVVDRAVLEEHACECYEVVKREYERLLPGPDDEEQVFYRPEPRRSGVI
jgi:CRP-like cAMP-binding protein